MSIEVLKGLERKISFTIKKNDIQEMVKTEITKYAKTAKAEGFRPGRVPYKIVEQMYGSKAYEESLNNQINKKFADIVVENKLNLAGYPKFDLTESDDEEFIFAAVFEIIPEVKIGELGSLEIIKPISSLTDNAISKTIEVLRGNRAVFNEKDKAAANNDKVTVDFCGSIDDIEFEGSKAENYTFILGQQTMLPDFEAGVIGLKAGQSTQITATFPDSYHVENLKGKTAVFKISVKLVAEQQLPELNEEFIKSMGINDGTVETLTKEIKDNLNYEVNRRLRAKLRDNVLKALYTAMPIDVPHSMVHDEIHRMRKKADENVEKLGYSPKQLTDDMFINDAKYLVTLRLLVQEYIKENAISVNTDEVKSHVIGMGVMYDDPDQYVKWYYQDQTRINTARAIAMENKMIDSILSKVKIREKEISYDELMREQI